MTSLEVLGKTGLGAPAMTAKVQARDREGPGQWPGPGEAQMGEGDMGPVG